MFLGQVNDEDLIAYYPACDIIAFPSITENEAFGITLAEGMFFGKPAVTSRSQVATLIMSILMVLPALNV